MKVLFLSKNRTYNIDEFHGSDEITSIMAIDFEIETINKLIAQSTNEDVIGYYKEKLESLDFRKSTFEGQI